MPSHQELAGHQKKTVKKAGHWSRFGKFKVAVKKTLRPDYRGTSAMRDNGADPKPRKKTPYELRDQELKTEESKLA